MERTYAGKIEDLVAGDTETIVRTLQESDIDRFADTIDSHHPIHMSGDWVASESPFGGGRLVHGLMTAALVSRTIVNFLDRHDLKGAICYTASKFVAPVRAGDTVTIALTFQNVIEGTPKLRFTTEVRNQRDEVVMVGEIHEYMFL
jgi:3-hydroxybutyryl-CoA dehydratase